MRTPLPAALALLITPAPITAQGDPDPPPDPLFPHPVITEILFNVPRAKSDPDRADANLDGARHSTADEFVELFNPHPRTINLRGYTITNRITAYDDETKRGVRFTFPDVELPPGAVAVVFNGHDARIPGPVGTDRRPPRGPNERFSGALVFTMNPSSRTNAFANAADFCLLSDPRNRPIDAVTWGDPEPEPPHDTIRIQEVDKNPKGAVQRLTAHDRLIPHRLIDRSLFSPGRLPPDPAAATTDAHDDEQPDRD